MGEERESAPVLRLFDRDRAAHPWAEAFAEMQHFDEGRRWVAAANWRMDHRVSADRESADLSGKSFSAIANASDWWAAQNLYFQGEICRPSDPPFGEKRSAYCREANEGNRISVRLPSFDQLVHVGSFNGMLRRIVNRSEAAADVEIGFREILDRGLPDGPGAGPEAFNRQVSELAKALAREGEGAVQRAAGLLVEGLGDPQPPWWAAFDQEVREVVRSHNAADFCIALGLGHYALGEPAIEIGCEESFLSLVSAPGWTATLSPRHDPYRSRHHAPGRLSEDDCGV